MVDLVDAEGDIRGVVVIRLELALQLGGNLGAGTACDGDAPDLRENREIEFAGIGDAHGLRRLAILGDGKSDDVAASQRLAGIGRAERAHVLLRDVAGRSISPGDGITAGNAGRAAEVAERPRASTGWAGCA